jgi:lincosamide and streptogramin A transport system ATP-binding/permease protein
MPFLSLSCGEKLSSELRLSFLKKTVLLLDEPFSHLDEETRLIMAEYLSRKKGFILVSHERDLLDRCVDHILSINRDGITLTHGNYSVWATETERNERFEERANEKLKKEISRLQSAAQTNTTWAKRVEATKYGNGPVDRGYIGHKSAKMMQRAKAVERRQERTMEEKKSLLRNAEQSEQIELKTAACPLQQLMELRDCSVIYDGRSICDPVTFEILQGERIAIKEPTGAENPAFSASSQEMSFPTQAHVTENLN